jgi:hypothetical protein
MINHRLPKDESAGLGLDTPSWQENTRCRYQEGAGIAAAEHIGDGTRGTWEVQSHAVQVTITRSSKKSNIHFNLEKCSTTNLTVPSIGPSRTP